jgi:hypothetical protein
LIQAVYARSHGASTVDASRMPSFVRIAFAVRREYEALLAGAG